MATTQAVVEVAPSSRQLSLRSMAQMISSSSAVAAATNAASCSAASERSPWGCSINVATRAEGLDASIGSAMVSSSRTCSTVSMGAGAPRGEDPHHIEHTFACQPGNRDL